MTVDHDMPIHVYLRSKLADFPELTHADLARVLGYPRPNVISMILQGQMNLPIGKVPVLAKLLEIPVLELFERVATSFHPETMEVLRAQYGGKLVTQAEMAVVTIIRDRLGNEELALASDADFRAELLTSISAAGARLRKVADQPVS